MTGRRMSRRNINPNRERPAGTGGREPGPADEMSPLLLVTIAAALVLMTAAAYWPVSQNGFVNFDDETYVTQNRHVSEGLSWQGVKWAFTEFYACNWHPLTWISHMLDVQIFGMQAKWHHLVSLAFHILNILLLFGILRCTTRRVWASAFVAALFAMHPLHVESVAWIAERKDVLSTFFWLGAIWVYWYYGKRPRWGRYAGVAVLFALGLMSKPMVVTLPLILLLLDYWPLERYGKNAGKSSLSGLIVEKLPLVGMSLVSAIVTVWAQRGAISTLDTVSLSMRLANAIVSYGRYVWEMVWPAKLAVLYPYPRHPQYAEAAVVLVLLVAATAASLYFGRRMKFLVVGWFWYLATLVPVIGLIQVGEQSHADRYTYLPLVGLFVIVAWAAAEMVKRKPVLRFGAIVVATAILMVAGIMTFRQAGYWKDSISLFERAIAVTTDNHLAMTNLGNALVAGGEPDRAMEQFRESLQLAPKRAETLSGIGRILFERNQLKESWDLYKRAAELRPQLQRTQLNAGVSLIALGRFAEAEPYLRKALELDSVSAEAWTALGRVLGATGRVEEGIATCRKAIEISPGFGAAHYTIATLYRAEGDMAAAAAEYRICIDMQPTNAAVWNDMGSCLLAAGKKDDAVKAFREAVRLEPASAAAQEYLKSITGDGK
jgi:tetratricopeptide (TPR) repeat protein